MEFGLYMFELYLKHSLTETDEYLEVFTKMLKLESKEPFFWKQLSDTYFCSLRNYEPIFQIYEDYGDLLKTNEIILK